MSKGLRLTEKWLQRGLWLVAFAFAAFLVGLGGKIVDNLWDVEDRAVGRTLHGPGADRPGARRAAAGRRSGAMPRACGSNRPPNNTKSRAPTSVRRARPSTTGSPPATQRRVPTRTRN